MGSRLTTDPKTVWTWHSPHRSGGSSLANWENQGTGCCRVKEVVHPKWTTFHAGTSSETPVGFACVCAGAGAGIWSIKINFWQLINRNVDDEEVKKGTSYIVIHFVEYCLTSRVRHRKRRRWNRWRSLNGSVRLPTSPWSEVFSLCECYVPDAT